MIGLRAWSLSNQSALSSLMLEIIRKAFYSVPNAILVNKLQSHGLNVYVYRWICDYLSGGEQCVFLKGVTSRPQPSGVPQGTV